MAKEQKFNFTEPKPTFVARLKDSEKGAELRVYVLDEGQSLKTCHSKHSWYGPGVIVREHRPSGTSDHEFYLEDPEAWKWITRVLMDHTSSVQIPLFDAEVQRELRDKWRTERWQWVVARRRAASLAEGECYDCGEELDSKGVCKDEDCGSREVA